MRFQRLLGMLERRLLSTVMGVIAFILDRQLRGLQARAAKDSEPGIKVQVDI